MRKLYLILLVLCGTTSFSQFDFPTPPHSFPTHETPDWTVASPKVAVDTCGPYFNNYVGLVKTTDLYFEELRTGDGADFAPYAGRGQRFHANQPIEVSGIQFYSFQNNLTLDSLPVVTVLYDYEADTDSIGVEFARDTVWVKHTEFTPLLPELEVNSYFDEPVVVTEDYVVALYTFTNDSLKIITNDPGGDGDMEGVSFAYYDNPVAPSFTGWYPTLPTFGPAYDIDYLISPLIRYDLHDGFTLDNDTVCPNVVSAACVDYLQVPNFSDPHYNRFFDEPAVKVNWNWGDGLQNTGLTSVCHTYLESGTYTITLIDSIRRHDYFDFTCAVEVSQTVVVLDSATASATHSSSGLTAVFDGEATLSDSVSWDFGDGNTSTELDPTYSYEATGTYEVWFYAYGPCNTDSVMVTVVADDVSLDENKLIVGIYPNPANQQVFLSGMQSGTTIELLNILGEVIYTDKSSGGLYTMTTENLADGPYFIRLKNEKAETVKKLIVKH